MTPEEQIKNLREQIAYHSDRYYNQDNPEISDYEFDQLMLELKRLEREHPELVTPDSPTQKVGGTAKRTAGCVLKGRDLRFCGTDERTAERSGVCRGV